MASGPTLTVKQTDRLLKIKTTLGETKLVLERFAGPEILSQPFEFKLTLLSSDDSINIKSLLRTSATITIIMADSTERYFNGIFASITQSKAGADTKGKTGKSGLSNPDDELAIYEAVMVPKFWFLALDSDCKIFQNMTVQAIVEKILGDKGVSDYSFRLNGSYPTREYCVQYRESSLTFISRLLEEEGIFYFFEHTDTKHTIVFADKSSILQTCPGQESAEYSFSGDGWVGKGKEGVASLERIETAYSGKAACTDYYFETPKLSLMSNLSGNNEEVYDYPGEYTTKDDGDRYVRIRLEEREALQFVVNGTSRCRAFRAGVNFKLEKHFRKDTNQDYFLTSVVHEAWDSTYRQNSEKAHYYKNSFTAIPKTVPYRPPRDTPRPTVHGLQPALVVGKSGEEIWVDKYGRVKVQFYWDRVGKKNEDSSCWVRVSQVWAGKNWGWMTIPRVGQEVLVDFLEGDPDRPIIVGRVYNADQMPPWTLPDNQTQSGILTRSSKGGGTDNFNRIQFEDKTDNEFIDIWAQKDMKTTVEHDDTQHVMNDRTINVDGKHTETIVKDTSITITQGNHSTTVQTGNQSIEVDQGNQTTTIKMGDQSTTLNMGNQSITLNMGNQSTQLDMGNVSVNCDLGSISMEAMQSITLTVGASSITITPAAIEISSTMISISGDAIVEVSGDAMLDLSGGITMINCG
ncbi:MAG TPA: type VI secretion system tip protein TssI/VgrG [Bryobacteraceae bacterium]|nr:type VI secretion system tip protein TssI/VgrG [Bryobacteraceae bacterium]